jgi:sulfate transport system ATP-binding protein
VRTELRAWLRRLHDDMNVTTVFVTHDQEEAMEVADTVVVMNHGRIVQEGNPQDVYDHPADEFVMHFMGHVNVIGDAYVRPHDVEIRVEPNGTTSRAVVRRVPARPPGARRLVVEGAGMVAASQPRRDRRPGGRPGEPAVPGRSAGCRTSRRHGVVAWGPAWRTILERRS